MTNLNTNSGTRRYRRAFYSVCLGLLFQGWGTSAPASDLYHHVDRATQFETEGKTKEAVIEWKNALRYDPTYLDARLALGKLYIQLADGERAEKEIRRAHALGAKPNSYVSTLAAALLLQKSYAQLVSELQPTAEEFSSDRISPDNRAQLLIARGHALTALDRLDDARASFEGALDVGRRTVEARLGLAFVGLREGNLEEAARLCNENLSETLNNVRVLLLRGEVYRRLKRFETAAGSFQRALHIVPRQKNAFIGLARSRIAQHRYAAAGDVLDRFGTHYPHDPDLQYLRATLAFREGRYPDAGSLLGDLINRYPGQVQAQLLSATVSYLLGHQQQALSSVNAALSLNPQLDAARRLKSLIEMKHGSPEDVISTLEPSIENAPDDAWLAAMSAHAALRSRQPEAAQDAIERILETSGTANEELLAAQRALVLDQIDTALASLNQFLTRPLAQRGAERIERALLYLQQGQWDKAEAESAHLLAMAPEEALTHHIAALVYLGREQPLEAIANLEYAIGLQPDFTPSLVTLGRLHLANQTYGKALETATALRAALPDKPMGPAMEGDVYLAQGDRAKAIKAYREALNKANTRLAIRSLSQRLVGLRESTRVISKLEQWIRSHPDDVELRVFLALQLQVLEQAAAAMEHYRAVLELDPQQLVALNELAVWQQRQHDLETAVAYAEHAYSVSPENPVIEDTLGWIRLEQGRLDEARELLDSAFEELQGVPVAHYHYGVLMTMTGKHDLARQNLNIALSAEESSFWSGDAWKWLQKLPEEPSQAADTSTEEKTH